MKRIYLLLLFLVFGLVYAQDYSADKIPAEIKEDAYAIVRKSDTSIDFLSYDRMSYSIDFVITVLNESGKQFAVFPAYYDKNRKIKKFEASLYDANGKLIKKLKKKDLRDSSVYDGFSLFIDDRVQYYDINYPYYPYTVVYHVEMDNSSTLTIPYWSPVRSYNLGIESSTYKLTNHTSIDIRKKESGFDSYKINKSEEGNVLSYSIQNVSPLQSEVLSPPMSELTPRVRFAPSEFMLAGVKGKFENWEEFGKWYYENLLKDKNDLSEDDKNAVLSLLDGVDDPIEKIKILYQFLQTKTRYINVAVGIGGWEPFPASYVNSKSYGDCKALSNYMVSLLKIAGIDANYTVVYGNPYRKESLEIDFASLQGNHVIVNVPLENGETIWLECTSQQTAFNYLGSFTDDRYALSITPQGGEIVKTQKIDMERNRESVTGSGRIESDGKLKANFSIGAAGLFYDYAYGIDFMESKDAKDRIISYFHNQNNVNLLNYNFDNDRNNAEFIQTINVELNQYAKKVGNDFTLNLIPVGRNSARYKKDDNRKFPFEVRFGYFDELEFTYELPPGYRMGGEFKPIIYIDDFGSYFLTVEQLNGNQIKVKRVVNIKEGTFPKDKFNDYVEFYRRISSFDQSKILLEKI